MTKSKQVSQEGLVLSGEGEDLVVDLSNAEDGFELMPRATYNCIVSDLEYGYSQANNPMWTWKLEVEDGEYSGRKLPYYTTFSDKAIGMAKQTIGRVAPDLAGKPFNPSEIADSGVLIGVRCRAKVIISRYEGEKRNNVRMLMPPLAVSEAGFLEG